MRLSPAIYLGFALAACNGGKSSSEGQDKSPGASQQVSLDHQQQLIGSARVLLKELAALESKRDVTCWTSFRQLDWYIAEKSYSDFATIAKITAIRALTRAAWSEASDNATGKVILSSDLQPIKARLPEISIAGEKRSELEKFANDIGLQNFTDYQKTAEHLRIVLAVVQDEIYRRGDLKPLDEGALADLADIATTLSLMLLKQSSEVAAAASSEIVEGEHVQAAFSDLRSRLKLTNAPVVSRAMSYADALQSLAPLTRTLIEGKGQALATFNKTSTDLSENLNRVARLPLTPEATQVLRLRLQSFVHFVSAGFDPMRADNYLDDGQYARTRMERKPYLDYLAVHNAITQLYPHSTFNNGDVLIRFEPSPGPVSQNEREPFEIRLLDHEMNGVRDSAIHWLVLATVWREKPFAMDPFAAEYLSEVVSMMMTMYLRRGEMIAEKLGKNEIDAEVARRIHDPSYVQVPPSESRRLAWGDEQKAQKRQILSRYPPTLFRDVTASSGLPTQLARFGGTDPKRVDPDLKNVPGHVDPDLKDVKGHFDLQTIMGGGIAVGDVNRDGYPDLFLTGESLGRLYVNRGAAGPGTFEDATLAWGIPEQIDDGHGALFFDLEGDGDLDLLVLRSRNPSLLLVQQNGSFIDRAGALGLRTHRGAHVASIFDYDRDGDLDIYIGYYGSHDVNIGKRQGRSLPAMDGRNGSPNQLWRQDASGRFHDVADQAGVADLGWTLAVGAFDHDLDGDIDLYVANDFGANRLFENDGDGTFTDITDATHTGDRGSGMNVEVGEVNGDGRWDLYITNIDMFSKRIKVVFPTDMSTIDIDESLVRAFQYLSGNKLYVSFDKAGYRSEEAQRFEPGDRGWGWDAAFFDYENDGDDDLYVTNGWINGSYAGNQKNQMYIAHDGIYYLAPTSSPESFAGNSRNAAAVDIDRDGDLDLVTNQFRQPPRVLRNEQRSGNHWLQLRLSQRGKNSAAVGARIEVLAEGRKALRHVQRGRGYLSQADDVITIGLGKATSASVTVVWPDGKVQEIDGLALDRAHDVVRGP